MINLQIGSCELKTNKDVLEKFALNNYLRFYKKDKLRHVTRNDKRLPKIKKTDDIFSMQIWFKDKSQGEHRFFIDGTILLDTIKIHTITMEKYSYNDYEYSLFLEILKDLTLISEGYILISSDSVPQRIINGKIQKYEKLIQELYSNIPKEKQNEDLYNWIIKSSNTTSNDD